MITHNIREFLEIELCLKEIQKGNFEKFEREMFNN